MQNPLSFFKDLIFGGDLAFVRHEFTQNPSYDPENDTIFAIGSDPFAKQTVEYKLSYSNHLKQLLNHQLNTSIKLLDDNLHSIVSTTGKADYSQAVEDELNYLIAKVSQRTDSSSEIITNELNELLNYITEKYRRSGVVAPNAKIVWKGKHEIFYALFRALHEEKLIDAGTSKNHLIDVAKLLFAHFELKPKQEQVEEYTFTSFYQGFKHVKKEKGGDENYTLYRIKKLIQQLE